MSVFKVGDRVRVVGFTGSSEYYRNGDEGEIISIEPYADQPSARVRMNGYKPFWHLTSLELVEPTFPAVRSKVWVQAEVVGYNAEGLETDAAGEVKVRFDAIEESVWTWFSLDQIKEAS